MKYETRVDMNKANPIKRTASGVLLVLVFFLMLFPFINSLNQFLVNVIEPILGLNKLGNIVIPYEVRIVRVILEAIRIPITDGKVGSYMITIINKRGEGEPIAVAWNCIGWQSLIVIGATLLAGLTGKFTFFSKLEVLLIGLIGTFLLNIFRISAIFALYYHTSRKVALAFHDYGSVILTILWMFLLWYYALNFVLQSRTTD